MKKRVLPYYMFENQIIYYSSFYERITFQYIFREFPLRNEFPLPSVKYWIVNFSLEGLKDEKTWNTIAWSTWTKCDSLMPSTNTNDRIVSRRNQLHEVISLS